MKALDEALKLIGAKRGMFGDHLDRLESCRMRVKPNWRCLLPKFSTTTGPKTIWLASGVRSWHPESIQAMLCHESVHLEQWRHLGRSSFALKYAQRDGRLEMEIDALRANVWWHMQAGRGSRLSARGKVVLSGWMKAWIDRVAESFGASYYMGKGFDSGRLREALHGHVWGYLSRG